MHGKSPLSEHVLEKIKLNNYLCFKEDFQREILSFFCQNIIVVFIHKYFDKKDKSLAK